ncbi:cytochrome b561/ferric reductase transmembrane [Artemisia annua]|uniref:ascorbate ferrireductase (transmembrane) n=1 Tax=Artemisia annua TaxID=35608 RepID=A0A2U1MNP8_ARTAN|nr:cytochrome b561/ferric reductase transmembrane [Artemisia annua]
MAKGGSNYNLSAAPVTVFVHLLVISIATLTLVWLLKFRGGFAFKAHFHKNKIFNLHPLLMTLGFLLFSGEAIIMYKVIPDAKRKAQKAIHLIFHFIALVAGIVGVYAVFKFHHEVNLPHMYTLHSWIGLSAISLFGFQWLLGFFSFWYPRAEQTRRARMLPWHAFFGIVIFFMTIVTAETGLTQKFIFLGLWREQEALIINFTGLLILLFGIAVGLSVILPRRN